MLKNKNKAMFFEYAFFLSKLIAAVFIYDHLQQTEVVFVNAFYLFVIYHYYRLALFIYVVACLFVFWTKNHQKLFLVKNIIFVLFHLCFFSFMFFHLGFFFKLLRNRFNEEMGERSPFIVWHYTAGVLTLKTEFVFRQARRVYRLLRVVAQKNRG